jgi:hypothetical protein
MYIGKFETIITEKNIKGGGMVKILEKPYLNVHVGFSKFEGFQNYNVGDKVTVFFEHGAFKSVRRII